MKVIAFVNLRSNFWAGYMSGNITLEHSVRNFRQLHGYDAVRIVPISSVSVGDRVLCMFPFYGQTNRQKPRPCYVAGYFVNPNGMTKALALLPYTTKPPKKMQASHLADDQFGILKAANLLIATADPVNGHFLLGAVPLLRTQQSTSVTVDRVTWARASIIPGIMTGRFTPEVVGEVPADCSYHGILLFPGIGDGVRPPQQGKRPVSAQDNISAGVNAPAP